MIRITRNEKEEPSIRDLNLKVSDVLRWLGTGITQENIIENHPGLEREDFLAVYRHAANSIDTSPWDRIRADLKEKFDAFKVEKQRRGGLWQDLCR